MNHDFSLAKSTFFGRVAMKINHLKDVPERKAARNMSKKLHIEITRVVRGPGSFEDEVRKGEEGTNSYAYKVEIAYLSDKSLIIENLPDSTAIIIEVENAIEAFCGK
jgi:hypothetical protein